MALKEFIHIAIKAGKFIGNAKAVKNIADFASTNWKEKERQKQEERKKQEERDKRRKAIKSIRSRNIFETVSLYVIGAAAACYIVSFGWLPFIIVVFCYLMHMSELYKLNGSIDLKREWILTILSIMCMVIWFARHL